MQVCREGGEKEKVNVRVGEKKRRKRRKEEEATPCVGWSFSCRRDDRRACLFGGRDVTGKQTRQTRWHVTYRQARVRNAELRREAERRQATNSINGPFYSTPTMSAEPKIQYVLSIRMSHRDLIT